MYSVGKERKLELYRKVQQEQMSKEKFIEEMYRLYGITPELEKLLSILGRIFTTCDCFWPDATEEEINPPLVINEEMFRKEIGALSEELQPLIDDYLQEKVDLTNPAKTN